MKFRALGYAAFGICLSVACAQAADTSKIIIDFEDDVEEDKPNGFSSVDSPRVKFFDTDGEDMDVFSDDVEVNGKGLRVLDDDPGALRIKLKKPATRIALSFGNDDACCSDPGDVAALILLRNGVEVGRKTVVMNRDDFMNQRIAYQGRVFDTAIFQYQDPSGDGIDLIEIVDDIVIGPLCSIAGDADDNELVGTRGNNVICGDAGNDTIQAGRGDDVVFGGPGNDTINGGAGEDLIFGEGGADTLRGGADDDTIIGGSGGDLIVGGSGTDTCDGGAGNNNVDCEVQAAPSAAQAGQSSSAAR